MFDYCEHYANFVFHLWHTENISPTTPTESTAMNQPIAAYKTVVALDCPDAQALADFYAALLGWTTQRWGDNWVNVLPATGQPSFHIGCQEVDGYTAPDWPAGPTPQQAHLDFYVDSIEDSTEKVLALGGIQHEHQPSPDGQFRVFIDPAGHPFCLCMDYPAES